MTADDARAAYTAAYLAEMWPTVREHRSWRTADESTPVQKPGDELPKGADLPDVAT